MLARVAVGVTDLLLAAVIYVLFLRMQGSPILNRHWWSPPTVLSAAIAAGILVVGRSLLDMLSTWLASRQIQGIYKSLMFRLLQAYSEIQWECFVERNRNELVNNVVHTAREAADFYHRWVELTSSVLVVVMMIAALVYQSPAASAGLGILVVLFYALHRKFIGKRLRFAASTRERSIISLQRHIADVFASAKEIRTYLNHKFFVERITEQSDRLSSTNLSVLMLPQIARIVADQGVILLFLCVVVGTQLRHGDTRELLSLLAYYFALSRRLIPLISQIFFIAGQMEGSHENIRRVDAELHHAFLNRNRRGPTMLPGDGFSLEVSRVAYSFHEGLPILQDVNLYLRTGESVILRGESGSGKSSLLNIIAGVSQPARGSVHVDRSRIAYVPQESPLLDDTVRNNLLFGLSDKSDDDLMKALTTANLEGFVMSQPLGLETPVGDNGIRFSGGERQRLGVARAVLRNATLLLLDEATSALDEMNEEQVLGNLKAVGVATIIVSHRPHAQRGVDRRFCLEDGVLIEDRAGQPRNDRGLAMSERNQD